MVPYVSTCSNTKATHKLGRFIRENVSEEVRCDDYVEALGSLDQLGGRNVDVKVLKRHIRIRFCHLEDCLFEDSVCNFENVPLVNIGKPVSPIRCQLKGELCNSLRSGFGNYPHCDSDAGGCFKLLARVQALCILSDDNHVDPWL